VYPGATETCNGLDDNCTMGIDDGLTVTGCYADGDADGYGAGSSSTQCRDGARMAYGTCPVGYTNNATDCNNAVATIRPGGTETCNGLDDDCDTMIDDGVLNTYYRDSDLDAFGVVTTTATGCTPPAGYVADGTDCDDTRPAIHPGSYEFCNGIDENCVLGTMDEPTTRYYQDSDSDAYGKTAVFTDACSQPMGYSSLSGDCNDANGSIRPGATEICNGIDDDCEGGADEAPAAAQCSGAYPLASGVSSWACTAATCVPTCTAGRGNCDGLPANGCEIDLASAPTHCGTCATSCGTGALCTASACDSIVDIDAGGNTTCARWSSDRLVCWGEGDAGQLATEDVDDSSVPLFIDDLPVVQGYTVGRHRTGGASHVEAFLGDATDTLLYGWGYNGDGQIGDGTKVSPRIVPVIVTALTVWQVDSGDTHTCRRHSGNVFCWGNNAHGQLGNGTTTELLSPPAAAVNLGGRTAIDLAAGYNTTCIAASSGEAMCWGRAGVGQSGDGVVHAAADTLLTPTLVSGASGVTFIEAGDLHGCAQTSAGFECWGYNSSGQVGDNTTTTRYASTPINTSAGAPITYTDASLGAAFTCAVASGTGQIWCWGNNGSEQLGGATTAATSSVPRRALPTMSGFTDVAAGYGHACARQPTPPYVYCWGANTAGQLGRGTTGASGAPAAVTGF
jgi:alpha-tubulin suppressor-like RCC1 family protein